MSSAGSTNSSINCQWYGTLKGMIKITNNIDYYYCIIKVPCSPPAWYYFCAIVINSWYSCILECTCMTEFRHTTMYTIMILRTCVIWSLSWSDNDTRWHVRMSSTGVGTPVWIASDIISYRWHAVYYNYTLIIINIVLLNLWFACFLI